MSSEPSLEMCTPVYVYVTISIILALCGLSMAISYGTVSMGVVNLIGNIAITIICAILLWLICNIPTAGKPIAWILVGLCILSGISTLVGYVSTVSAV